MSRVKTARRKAERASRTAQRARRSAHKTVNTSVAPRLGSARDTAVSYAGDAAEWVHPHYETARDRVKDDVVPKLSDAVTRGLAASEPVREEALHRGTAAIAALKGNLEPPKKKRRWGRRLLVLVGVAGAAAGALTAWSRLSAQGLPSTVEDERSTLAGRESGSADEAVDARDSESSSLR
ncbi:MAG: DUF5324 family protein [Actinomycetes bacterium]